MTNQFVTADKQLLKIEALEYGHDNLIPDFWPDKIIYLDCRGELTYKVLLRKINNYQSFVLMFKADDYHDPIMNLKLMMSKLDSTIIAKASSDFVFNKDEHDYRVIQEKLSTINLREIEYEWDWSYQMVGASYKINQISCK